MSRQREITGNISWLDTFKVIHSPSIGAIAGLGLVLIGLYAVWLAVAMGIYDLTMGPLPPASVRSFIHALFTTSGGWAMIVVGISVGAVFAVVALMIGVISFPLLLDRPVGFGTAIETSIKAVRRNPITLGAWGVIVAGSLVLGALPFFIGLIVVLPVLGACHLAFISADYASGGDQALRKSLLFVNKMKQKNFLTLGRCVWRSQRHTQCPEEQKFFGSFFQKRTTSFLTP